MKHIEGHWIRRVKNRTVGRWRSRPNHPQPRDWPLAWVLTAPFMTLSCAAVALAGALSIWAGERAVEDLSNRLHLQLRERVQNGLEHYFRQPKQATGLFLQGLNSQLISPKNLRQVGQYAWQLRQSFDVSYINFGLATGEFAGSGVGRDGVIVGERSAALGWRYQEFATDALGQRRQRVGSYPYDHRTEAWYRAAVSRQKPVWSEIYAWDSTPEFVSINYAVPLRDRAGRVVGAIGVDLLLDRISAMLKTLKVHPDLEITILERNGDLVGSSSGQPLFKPRSTTTGAPLDRITAKTTPDRRLKATIAELDRQGGLRAVNQPRSETFQVGRQTYLLWVSPWQDPDGLDWVMVATLPRSAFMNQIEANRRTTTLLCGLVIVMAVFLGWVMARQLAKPVRSLARAAGQLAAGDLNHRVEAFGIHELNDLAIAFNRMADELRQSLTALGSANQSLESRVVARTAALAQALSDLKSAQAQLIQTEKMSGLGQMVAGIAHEINNPVGFIHGNLGVLRQYIDELTGWLAVLGLPDRDRVAPEAIAQVRDQLDADEVAFVISDLPKLLQSMDEGTRRIQEIVDGLRNFSRLDQVDLKPVNLHDGLESTLLILTHRLKHQGDRPAIKIVKHYSSLVPVWCHPGQLNQVFMNLLANAIDALDEAWTKKQKAANGPSVSRDSIELVLQDSEPTITLSTRIIDTAAGPRAEVSISDNGVGIPSEIQNQLFDPFFTTKPVGKGTGLGLAIAYQIVVDRHHGQITCQSMLGESTTFILQIPIGQPASDPVERKTATRPATGSEAS